MAKDEQVGGTLKIPWSVLGLGGLVLGIGSLGTLITVVTLSSIDALSTVALVLAVLAFVIQIIVFIAQTAAANQQAVDVQAVNAETRALLAEVRTNTQQTNTTLREQFNRVLDGAFTGVQRAVSKPDEASAAEDAQDQEAELSAFRQKVLDELVEAKESARLELFQLGQGPPNPNSWRAPRFHNVNVRDRLGPVGADGGRDLNRIHDDPVREAGRDES